MSNNQINEKLQALFDSYAKRLPDKLSALKLLWANLLASYDQQKLQEFHRVVHSLCGSAGTYGYTELGKSARQLEIYLKSILGNQKISDQNIQIINGFMQRLDVTAFPDSREIILDSTADLSPHSNKNIAYIITRDKKFIADINTCIKESSYNFCSLLDISSLDSIDLSLQPVVMIIDNESLEERHLRLLGEIQEKHSVPIIYLSAENDTLTRLKSIRIGSGIFLKKPLDAFELVRRLSQFFDARSSDVFHILIVDDSKSLAEYFAAILQNAGMITHYITNPLKLIETIEEFQPDLLIIDVYMPECTGLELAAVLRQESKYMRIPIIFLSTEDDRLKQLSALNFGADDFLTKPILPQHLVEAVRSRAKRAGVLSSFMMRDSLTGLLNHSSILQQLDIEILRAQRKSEPLTFAMIDIDYFKNVNDKYGHLMGDKVIQTLSGLLLSSLRRTDIVGRYGGEEFAVIFQNTDMENAKRICNNIRDKFSRIPFHAGKIEFFTTFSVGISSFPEIQDTNKMIKVADESLYVAKNNGRNQVVGGA